jgi:hypothetical protein
MKLAWIFGSSMQARHLLYTYIAVWILQGGYFGWIAWSWLRLRKDSRAQYKTRDDL